MRIGMDVGSTTIKVVVMDGGRIIYKKYRRHFSRVGEMALEMLGEIRGVIGAIPVKFAISGSAGLGMADRCGVNFVQEVHATKIATEKLRSQTDVVVELGGEDAKIIFLKGVPDARMNGACAGGTGAFIDQMASLMGVEPVEMDALAAGAVKRYAIASRCGVFAKSDVQPLINQGARYEDIAASIFRCVVNQTVAGLARGREIKGEVTYLGGPLTFLKGLRKEFDEVLGVKGVCPEDSLYYVAIGAALVAGGLVDLAELSDTLASRGASNEFAHLKPLFATEAEKTEFFNRHGRQKAKIAPWPEDGEVYLGIDAGSTTVKLAVMDKAGALVETKYESNSASPVPVVLKMLKSMYAAHPGTRALGSAATGYGEELIKSAFKLDFGIVETVAHLKAAQAVMPEVDFIIDIGGQDMKCLKLRNGVIDNIHLNEACSSGCGSFIQTFASALGYGVKEFAALGLDAERPVDLGSRCTVFMNSSVKQAQKDGATTADISAGLSMSVVKNALYKVIRAPGPYALGENIVAQGGTFLNDAVLRSFETQLGRDVVRPDVAAIMGAYGAAIYAKERSTGESGTLGEAELAAFWHKSSPSSCSGCSNNCRLTVNVFSDGSKYISGNRCSRPLGGAKSDESLNMYKRKLGLLNVPWKPSGDRPVIGIPLALNMYELAPFWRGLFEELGFDVLVSPPSDRKTYLSGQSTVPSDTVCFPAKLAHGHIRYLLDAGVKTIFYPCMSYNIDEGLGDNHFNCPVVAYYPEVIANNMDLGNADFIYCYAGLHRPRELPEKLLSALQGHAGFESISERAMKRAVKAGYAAYERHMSAVESMGREIIAAARAQKKRVIVLAGRPYHIDPEVNHGIDSLISSMGQAIVTEDAVSAIAGRVGEVKVLNQWTYHSRLYAAAEYAAGQPDMEFVQIVSFGCGCDAITSDECRRIVESKGRIYTQIKIDEIENLAAARIRIRSLLAAVE